MQRLGQTRSAHRHDHMLLTYETFVRAPLPTSWRIWIEGEGGHAGAVPMPQRRAGAGRGAGRVSQMSYFPTTSTWKLSGTTGGRPFFWPSLASGAGPYSAASRYTLCVFSSTAMVRAPRSVGTLSTASYLPLTSLTMVSVPSPLELKARPGPGSKPPPSVPEPMAGVAITLKDGMSTTAIVLLSAHTG